MGPQEHQDPREWRAVAPGRLADVIAEHVAERPGVLRLAVDGAPASRPCDLAAALCEPLRLRGRPAHLVHADAFWRDRSLRFEYGREDVDSYRRWLDIDALRREVLDAAAQGWFVPSLRDPHTNRSTHVAPRELAPSSVVIVCGAFLLGRDLPFDVTAALTLSPAALRRQTPEDQRWTLPAFAGYSPAADVTIRLDDPRHPALRA